MTNSNAPTFELGQFHIVPPRITVPQEDTLDWLATAHATAALLADPAASYEATLASMRQRLQRFGCKANQVASRGYDTFDIRSHDFAATGLYALGKNRETGAVVGPTSAPLGERTAFYLERTNEVFAAFYPEAWTTTAPDHLIHVTCTGYVSPSAPQRLVQARGWATAVTHAYHMGCYAAFPALRLAEGLAHRLIAKHTPSPCIDLAHTELCTLHLNPAVSEPSQMVIHSLFADGHIKYSLRAPGSLKRGFRLLEVHEMIIPDSAEDMTWAPDHWGFRMGLSREVPRKIGAHLRTFVVGLATAAGCDLAALLKHAAFAIHPGGPRIIDTIQEILELRDDQTQASRDVLLNRGNMSSATLPHVWQALDAAALPAGTKVVSLAFGPGLTIFGAVFAVI